MLGSKPSWKPSVLLFTAAMAARKAKSECEPDPSRVRGNSAPIVICGGGAASENTEIAAAITMT